METFFVGSYTESPGKGKGIYTCSLEPSTGAMTVLDCFTAIANPSYLSLDKTRSRLYAVHEAGLGSAAVSALSVDASYKLSLINTQKVPGSAPCHLALDPEGAYLAVANYVSGNVVLYPLARDGSLAEPCDNVQHLGKSINSQRQEGPHAHATVFDAATALLFVTDLGTDELKTYALNEGKLEAHSSLKLKAGAGPRHLVFHPSGRYIFVVNELDSSISLLSYQGTQLRLLGSVSTLPVGFSGESYCAAIRMHPSGRYVYASNRGHDSIAVFAFEQAQEQLLLIEHVSTQGQFPRDFALNAQATTLIAANQHSHDLFSYHLDAQTGRLSASGQRLELGSPVCVCMV